MLHDDGQSLSSLSSQMSTTVADLEKLPHVLSAQNPLSGSGSSSGQSQQNVGPLSDDGKTAYITVRFDVQPSTLGDDYLNGVDDAVQPLRSAGAEVEYGGPLGELARPAADDRVSELIGFGVAVVVLLVGFGSVLAAGVPLLTALISVVGGLAVLGLLAAAFTFATVSPTLATMIGLGVGIDYALFLITRHRQNVLDGADPVRAAGQAAATSGRAVLVSGCTVIIALAGLSASGVSFITKLGFAAAPSSRPSWGRSPWSRPCSGFSAGTSTATGCAAPSPRPTPRRVTHRRAPGTGTRSGWSAGRCGSWRRVSP